MNASGATPSGRTIRRWECPECGRIFGSAPVSDEVIGATQHSPRWSPEFERNPKPCDGTPIEREYVATEALLSPAVNKAAGKALAKQLAESHESGSFADVYEEAAIVLQTAIRATIAGLGEHP